MNVEPNLNAPSAVAASGRAIRPQLLVVLSLVAIVLGLAAAILLTPFWREIADSTLVRSGVLASARLNLLVLAVPLALWAIPATNRAIAGLLDRIRDPLPTSRRLATITIWLGAAAAFYGLSIAQGRVVVPMWHDSNMHMVQAQLVAHGKLWAAPHPLADHMETFHVFVRPVYAAIHFPGTSMLYAPFLMMDVGPAVFSALVGGAVVALLYRILTEIVDGVAGALAVPMLLGFGQLRLLSVMLMSHHVVLLPILLAVWAYLHWRRRPGGDLRWALAIGGLLGFALITRPVEAIAYSVGIAGATALSLRGAPPRRWLSTGLTVVAATLPCVALQLVFNRNVTGEWLLPPYEHYNHLFHPGLGYGSLSLGEATLPTNLPQKLDYYHGFIAPSIEAALATNPVSVLVKERIPLIAMSLLPNPLMLAFWVPALLGLDRRERWIFVAASVAYLLLCLPYVIFLTHYAVGLAPLGALLGVLGVHVVGRTLDARPPAVAGRRRRSAEVLAAGCFAALALTAIPKLDPLVHDDDYTWAEANFFMNLQVADKVTRPAVVLSRYRLWSQPLDPQRDQPHDEPVYTIDALWPEDSPIARLQDLGPGRNKDVYAFFAARQPERTFYLLDRRNRRLSRLGTAAELLANGEPPVYFEALKGTTTAPAATGPAPTTRATTTKAAQP